MHTPPAPTLQTVHLTSKRHKVYRHVIGIHAIGIYAYIHPFLAGATTLAGNVAPYGYRRAELLAGVIAGLTDAGY